MYPRLSIRGAAQAALVCALLLLAGCRDSPDEVLLQASRSASENDIVEMREMFSVATTHRLQHAWRADGIPEGRGWEDLAGKLVFNGGVLEVDPAAVSIYGDFARVNATAGANSRAYYLRKEDGRWRIDLGGGSRFRKAEAIAKAEKGEAPAEEK